MWELRWNPRFKNPWTDSDANDFDKNSWQIAVDEFTHNMVSQCKKITVQ